jgi:hypothetical protein
MNTSSSAFRQILLLLVSAIFFTTHTYSQTIRCATVEMDAALRSNNTEMESPQQFETWIHDEIAAGSNERIINGVYTIPVVFHVIHSGEAVGTGTNISQAALQSQIDVLNEDFRRILGSNGYNTNPVGADTEIEFCLAQRRPDGSAFTAGQPGVNRILYSTISGTAPPYSTAFIDATVKPWTYNGGTPTATRGWDPGKYLNIWICDITGGILGYAQFPQSPLGGMGCGNPTLSTDGVVFLYSSIGKSSVTGFPAPYNEGRTATHEIGHWLGLRHIWGDVNDCVTDDYCYDTPIAFTANFGCPTGLNSCAGGGNDQIQNYMDYTDDLCMNVFTLDQKQRMRTVLTSTPLRMSLINSDACIPPNANDASVINILNPVGDNCAGAITPQVTIKNRGSANLTSATVNYTVDNGTVTTFSYSGTLAPGATANVTLPAFTTTLGTHTFTSYTTLPNGVTDPSVLYDTTSISFAVSNGYMAPYTQDFESPNFPPDIKWTVNDPNNDCYTWVGESAISSAGANTNAAMVRCRDYVTNGRIDYLYTPIFILPCNATVASFQFDVAHRQRNTSTDRLEVEISTDCGNTWGPTPTAYNKSGATLATVTPASGTSFIPAAAGDWRNEVINLMPLVSGTSKSIKFRFKTTNNNGNNIWVDNVKFNATTPGEINLTQGLNEILDGGAYSFGTTSVGSPINTTFTITNTGTTNLVLTPPINITGTAFTVNTSFGATTILPGATTTFIITFNPPSSGFYNETLSFTTNDCDETTFNFQLTGTVTGPAITAAFNGTPTTVCIGQTVIFTDMSAGATSWSWNFGAGATPPTANTQGPHNVTYSTSGNKTIALTVNGTTTNTQTNYITVRALPTTANAGPDIGICTINTATMAANTPTTGTGTWTFISGPSAANITTPGSPTSGISNMINTGNYVFQWTITNAPCTASSDQVTITKSANTTAPAAGPDQSICSVPGSTTFVGNPIIIGTGQWSQTGGPVTAIINNVFSPVSTVTGLTTAGTYTFRWTVANNGACPVLNDQMQIVVTGAPTVAAAGPDQTICSTNNATLAGNTATTGSGTWTFIGGPATPAITTPGSPTSGVTNLTVNGTYTFQWTITNAPCPASSDQVTITRGTNPTTANAGPDQNICSTSGAATMAANTPGTGTGSWTQISGPVTATITTPGSPASTITGMSTAGTYVYQWNISNAPCTASTDQVQVIVKAPPTVSNAGPDQTICGTSIATLAGNTITSGAGTWTQISGPSTATITTPGSPTSGLTAMINNGTYVFQWTTTNAPCTASSDQVQIIKSTPPTTANAGTDQTICTTGGSATMAGNTAAVGTGAWTQISGPVTATITTPGSPTTTITGMNTAGTYVYQWAITNATCPSSTDQVQVIVNAPPTASNAGSDQTICGTTTATLAGNAVTSGAGTWTQISGPSTATITTPGSPASGLTGMINNGTYVFQWTITNAPCTASSDQVQIIKSALPTTSNAGGDQTICTTSGSATMAGNTAVVGTGAWTQISGPVTASITTPGSPTTTITGMNTAGTYVYQWAITNATCPPSNDQVQVIVNAPPTASNAGGDQTICTSTAILAGNIVIHSNHHHAGFSHFRCHRNGQYRNLCIPMDYHQCAMCCQLRPGADH